MSSHHIYKIAILGDGASGKTSLIRAKMKGEFTEDSKITIGVDIQCIPFEYHTQEIDDGNQSEVLLTMDLGGQKRFHFIHDAYIKGIKGAIILYDLTRVTSFLNLSNKFAIIYRLYLK